MLSFDFSEDQEDFRQTMRDFTRKRLIPGLAQRAKSEEYPWVEHKALADMGVLGIGLPTEYGGTGDADYIALGIACEELGAGDVSLSSAPTQVGLIADLIARHGSPEAREKYLPRLVAGDLMVAIALTEPEAGSDASALRTTAKKVDGGWVLSGEKTSITLVQHSEAAIIFAREPGTTGSRGISAFLMDYDQDGVELGDFHDMGLISIGRGTISMQDAFVSESQLLGELGRGFPLVMKNFDFSRATIGLQCLGAARASLEEASEYLKQRKTFGKPLAARQGLSFQVAEHYTYLEAARLLCYQTLWLRQQGRRHTAQAAMVKWWAPRVAQAAIESALLIHGHAAWSDEMPHQARLRDVMAFLIADGTAEIQKLIIGQEYIGPEVMDRMPRSE